MFRRSAEDLFMQVSLRHGVRLLARLPGQCKVSGRTGHLERFARHRRALRGVRCFDEGAVDRIRTIFIVMMAASKDGFSI
jgi:hypothetical protein